MARKPRCEHCGAVKQTHAGLCPKCSRLGTPILNRNPPLPSNKEQAPMAEQWPICKECGGRHAETLPGCCSGTYDGKHAPPWGLGRLRSDREEEQRRNLIPH